MRTVVVADLDRTLIYSAAALGLTGRDEEAPRLLCVEVYAGRPLSFVTERAAADLTGLAEAGVLVPVTTRTVAQLRRVHLPGPPPAYALCANGGRLLRDGVEDRDFTVAVADRLLHAGAPLPELRAELERALSAADPFVEKVRDADGLFCYAVVDRGRLPPSWVEELTAYAEERGWAVSVQGRKVYCVPAALTKAAAAREVAALLGADRLVAAGDSVLDRDLLEAADAAIRPAHGELHALGWTRPHVSVTREAGVLAGEEVAAWLARQAEADLRSSREGQRLSAIAARVRRTTPAAISRTARSSPR
jgi:hypothetical protein